MEQYLEELKNKADALVNLSGKMFALRGDIEKRVFEWENDYQQRLERIEEKIRDYSELLNETDYTATRISKYDSLKRIYAQLSHNESILRSQLSSLRMRKDAIKNCKPSSYCIHELIMKFYRLCEDPRITTDAAYELLEQAGKNGKEDEEIQKKAETLIEFADYWLAYIPYECGQATACPKRPAGLPTGNDKVFKTPPSPTPMPKSRPAKPASSQIVRKSVRAIGNAISEIDAEDECPRWGGILMLLINFALFALSGYSYNLSGVWHDVFSPLVVMFLLGTVIYMLWFGVVSSLRVIIAKSFTVEQVIGQILGSAVFVTLFWLLKLVEMWASEAVLCGVIYVLFVLLPLIAIHFVGALCEELDDLGNQVMIYIGAGWLLLTAVVIAAFSGFGAGGWGGAVPNLELVILSQLAFLLSLIAPFHLFANEHRFWGTVAFLLPVIFMILALLLTQDMKGEGWFVFGDLAVLVLSIIGAFKLND